MTAALQAGAPIKLDTDPESGLAADIAEAEEAVEEARDRVRKLESSLVKAQSEVDRLVGGGDDERAIAEAEDRLEAIRRRAVSAHLRVERAEAEVEKLLERGR
jgi:chromosome segregation ATPase